MAVVYNPNDPNAQQNQNKTGPQGQPLQTIGTAAPSAPASAGNAAAPQQPQGSGRFTNLQKYINANQNGSQQISQNIQNQFSKQNAQIAQNIQNSQNRLNQSTGGLNNQLGQQGSQVLQNSFQDPQAVLANQRALNQARNMQAGLGQNISNVEGVEGLKQQNLQSQLSDAQNTASLANTEGGRFQLLRNMLSVPGAGYSQGSQRLDQVLLQSQPDVAQGLQSGLSKTLQPNQSNLSDLQKAKIDQINSLRGLSKDRQGEWQGLLNNGTQAGETPEAQLNQRGLSDIEADSQSRLKNAVNDENVVVPALRDNLGKNNLSSAEIQRLGLNAGQQLYDVDPSQFMSKTDFVPDINNTADPNEVARYSALRQLGQVGSGGIFGDPSQAGTYSPFTVDKTGLQDAVKSAQKKYEVDNVNNYIQEMVNQGLVSGASFGHQGNGLYAGDFGGDQRAALGSKLNTLQQQMQQGDINPSDYFQKVQQAIKDNWGDSTYNRITTSPGNMGNTGYYDLYNYGKKLNEMRNRALNPNDANAAPTNYGDVYKSLLKDPSQIAPKLGSGTPTPSGTGTPIK